MSSVLRWALQPVKSSLSLNSHQLDVLKWTALVFMVFDHVGLFWSIEPFRYAGRIVYPLFALVVAYNYLHNSRDKPKYLKRMLLWAFATEPFYQVAMLAKTGAFSFDAGGFNLNILFTLFIGLWITYCVDNKKPYLGIILAFLLPASFFLSYGLIGALLVPALYLVLKNGLGYKTTALAAFVIMFLNTPKYILATLLFIPLSVIASKSAIRLPRVSGTFFYAFYPAHLLFLSMAHLVAVR